MSRRILIAVLSVTLAAGAWAIVRDDGPERPPVPDAPEALRLRLDLAANLEPFEDCAELLTYFQETSDDLESRNLLDTPVVVAEEEAATFGGAGDVGASADATSGSRSAAAPAEAGGNDGSGGAPGFSGTNVQEAGVDEPDVVKTDGRLIITTAGGSLSIVAAAGGAAEALGSLDLPEGEHEILLVGDRALVLTRAFTVVALGSATVPSGAAPEIAPAGAPTTTLTVVDLADPREPRMIDRTEIEGDYVSARLHDGIVRVVLRSGPVPHGGSFPPGAEVLEDASGSDGTPAGEATLSTWLPDLITREEGDGQDPAAPEPEPLVACDAVARPPEPSGVGVVTVLTVDPAEAAEPLDTDAVVADAQSVYASTTTLYVATNRFDLPGDRAGATAATTELHAFDISDPRSTTYLASGRVRGQLLNQWSLSEAGGHLRVATTDGSPWAPPGSEPSSESFLTVLQRDGDALRAVGQVGNLGRGERIHAVRYVGDVAFVVTFRETDPLYTIDLSDPTRPRVLGELKIPGVSTYLHPVSEDLVVGVGQDADADGNTLGTQVSLFDVSNLSEPRRLDQRAYRNAFSPVEHDHRAFLWWSRARTAVVPIQIWQPEPLLEEDRAASSDDVATVPPGSFTGAVVLRISAESVDEAGRVAHDDAGAEGTIVRSLVVGSTLYTVSEAGVLGSDLGSLASTGWAPFRGLSG